MNNKKIIQRNGRRSHEHTSCGPDIYNSEAVDVAVQAMSHWDRDLASNSCGSFDRSWWGWKSRDFSDVTLQAAVELVIKVAEQKNWTSLMPLLLPRYITFLEKTQHSDGSFDQCYPNERTPGVFYDILPTLLTVHSSKWLEDPSRELVEKIINKGMKFALSTDEKHGEISNHLAHFSYGLLLHWKRFGDPRSHAKAKSYIDRLLSNFDPEEGWFNEYDGPDAGYQSRSLTFLALAANILDDEGLWDVCAKAAQFIEIMLMPDNSLHPMLGVRSTALIYPSGFELLAARRPAFKTLANKIRDAWTNNRVALPSQLDFANAIRLGEDAGRAYEVASAPLEHIKTPKDGVFHTKEPSIGVTHLCRAGIFIRRDVTAITWVAWRLGGALVSWRSLKNGCWELVHEDAGYLLADKNTDPWLNRLPNSGRLLGHSDDYLLIDASFHQASHEQLTPTKQLILRFLNFTVLRFQRLGDIFRQLLVARLAGNRKPLPATLLRKIEFNPHSIYVIDRFQGVANLTRQQARAPLWRCRRVTSNHMASARYYQDIEGNLSAPWAELQPQNLEADPTFHFEISR